MIEQGLGGVDGHRGSGGGLLGDDQGTKGTQGLIGSSGSCEDLGARLVQRLGRPSIAEGPGLVDPSQGGIEIVGAHRPTNQCGNRGGQVDRGDLAGTAANELGGQRRRPRILA